MQLMLAYITTAVRAFDTWQSMRSDVLPSIYVISEALGQVFGTFTYVFAYKSAFKKLRFYL
jgi:hypothetical protein